MTKKVAKKVTKTKNLDYQTEEVPESLPEGGLTSQVTPNYNHPLVGPRVALGKLRKDLLDFSQAINIFKMTNPNTPYPNGVDLILGLCIQSDVYAKETFDVTQKMIDIDMLPKEAKK